MKLEKKIKKELDEIRKTTTDKKILKAIDNIENLLKK